MMYLWTTQLCSCVKYKKESEENTKNLNGMSKRS